MKPTSKFRLFNSVPAALAAGLLIVSASGPAAAHPADAAVGAVAQADADAVHAVMRAYREAMERLDVSGLERHFAPQNLIIESGNIEGDYANYLAHHLGPELAAFRSFRFDEYDVDVRLEDGIAIATVTYRFSIALKARAEPIVGQGVATTVLKKIDARWRILSMHTSVRRPT